MPHSSEPPSTGKRVSSLPTMRDARDRSASSEPRLIAVAPLSEDDEDDAIQVTAGRTSNKLSTMMLTTTSVPSWFTSRATFLPSSMMTTSEAHSSGPPFPKAEQFSLLHAAAITGDTNTLKKLLDAKFCDVDLTDKLGRTSLMFSVFGDYPDCTSLLLAAGASVAARDATGRTAAHWAAHHARTECLRLLLERAHSSGWSWTTADPGGVTVLHLATKNHHTLAVVLKAFDVGRKDIDIVDRNQRTALHWAASVGNSSSVRLLLSRHSSVEVPDVEGKTPLHWAASSRATLNNKSSISSDGEANPSRCLQLLMRASPTAINWQDYEGRTALHLAVADGGLSEVRTLLSSERCQPNALDNAFRSALHWSATTAKADVAAVLLNHRAKAVCKDAEGATPVHYAVMAGAVDVVREIAKRKEAVDEADFGGRTPLMWVCAMPEDQRQAQSELLSVLRASGADLEHRDRTGSTALHVAAAADAVHAVHTLLKLGSNVNALNGCGHTPLCVAAQLGYIGVLRSLLSRPDCDRLYQDSRGRHAIHWAAQSGHAKLIEVFFESTPPDDVIDEDDVFGRTPLMLAAHGGYVEAMKALIKQGANVRLVDHERMCALHWAAVRGHLDAVKLLLGFNAAVNNVACRRHHDDNQHEAIADQFTPLESSEMEHHSEISQLLRDHGALTLRQVQNAAAAKIQSFWRGHRIRTSLKDHRMLMLKHAQLRAEKTGLTFGHKVGVSKPRKKSRKRSSRKRKKTSPEKSAGSAEGTKEKKDSHKATDGNRGRKNKTDKAEDSKRDTKRSASEGEAPKVKPARHQRNGSLPRVPLAAIAASADKKDSAAPAAKTKSRSSDKKISTSAPVKKVSASNSKDVAKKKESTGTRYSYNMSA